MVETKHKLQETIDSSRMRIIHTDDSFSEVNTSVCMYIHIGVQNSGLDPNQNYKQGYVREKG